MRKLESPSRLVDVHTHLGEACCHVGNEIMSDLSRVIGRALWDVKQEEHREAMESVDSAIVLAFDAPKIGIVVPNEYVAHYASGNEKMIGFASVDPNRGDATSILVDAVERLGLQGLKLGPVYQHFHPHSPQSLDLVEVADSLGIPIIWHFGQTFVRDVPIEYAYPHLLDLVARRFPDTRMWIAHMGAPWFDDTMLVVRRHEHVYADMSATHGRPLQFYFGMMSAVEYGVMDRLMFGSDFPFATVRESIEALRGVNRVVARSGLPMVPEDEIEALIYRDSLALLGLDPQVLAEPGCSSAPEEG